MRIDRVPYTAVCSYLEQRDTILIPLGSCGQQGLHLPMGIATIITEAVATAAGDRAGLAVMPALPVNYAHLFLDYPGTLSARMDHYFAFLNDICHGLAGQGFRHFFFVNIHNGSVASIEATARDVRRHVPDAVFGACECFQLMREAADEPTATDDAPFGHASERTTCMALHLCPDLVQMDEARRGALRPLPGGFRAQSNSKVAFGRASIQLYQDGSDLNPMGCTGDPTRATAAKGEAIFEAVVGYVVQAATAFAGLTFENA
jgi:creatinine amidohydrolase